MDDDEVTSLDYETEYYCIQKEYGKLLKENENLRHALINACLNLKGGNNE